MDGERATLLAREAGMSRTALAVRFAELIGTTPMKYLTGQRMREAATLLRLGESVGVVADRVGYKSEAAFARKFKETIGVGPGAYRRKANKVPSDSPRGRVANRPALGESR